jgi:TPP-dependent trihydroxycyclohexane-1,2-dione (THcHDO) dehydratase
MKMKKINIATIIEQLQEIGEVIVDNLTYEEVEELQKILKNKKYITEFKIKDRDYLVLTNF